LYPVKKPSDGNWPADQARDQSASRAQNRFQHSASRDKLEARLSRSSNRLAQPVYKEAHTQQPTADPKELRFRSISRSRVDLEALQKNIPTESEKDQRLEKANLTVTDLRNSGPQEVVFQPRSSFLKQSLSKSPAIAARSEVKTPVHLSVKGSRAGAEEELSRRSSQVRERAEESKGRRRSSVSRGGAREECYEDVPLGGQPLLTNYPLDGNHKQKDIVFRSFHRDEFVLQQQFEFLKENGRKTGKDQADLQKSVEFKVV
jgi:hypothetical protein